jgi:molecular chaperone DnaK (HSP70)
MKCPFAPGECLGRECPGWSLGSCFIEIVLQKMDNISLKLDTLCNLTSLTVASHAASSRPKQAAPFKPAGPDLEKGPIEKDSEEAGDQPTFWNFPGVTPEPERHGAHAFGETAPYKTSEFAQSPEKRLETYSQDHTRECTKESGGETLPRDIAPGKLPKDALAQPHDGGNGHQGIVHDDKPLPEFPAKVSEIEFTEETEARFRDALGAARSFEPQELTLEVTAVEELAPEMTEGLATSERVLLMAQQTNGSGTIDVMYDGLEPELRAELSYEQPKETEIQLGEDAALTDAVPADQELAVPADEPLPETVAVQLTDETLSVEKVIDDITSVEEPAKTEAKPASTAAEPEVVPSTPPPVAETVVWPEAAAAETVPLPTVETRVEPLPVEETKPVSEEPGVPVLEAAPTAKKETETPVAKEAEEELPVEPSSAADAAEVDGLPVEPSSAADAAEVDGLPPEGAVEASHAENPELNEEALPSTDPSSWAPIGLVEAKGTAVLGIDFGTALSKVALKTDDATPAMSVPVALIAYEILHKADLMSHFESQSEFAEDSLIYFDQNEFVFCGALAKKLSLEAAEAGQSRPVIQNLKTFLVRGGANLQIHSDFFPASGSLDSQSVLAIYLAYLLRLTRHYLDKRTAKIAADLDATIRNFVIPTWIEERYREDVKRLFRSAAAYAFCLERWLKDDLIKGARLQDVRKALQEAREYKEKIEEVLTGSIVTESAAAGHTRLLTVTNEKGQPLTVIVVNVGAGFTDFALFTVAHVEGRETDLAAQVAYKGGVGTGLGVWDNALKTLLFNRVREVPAARKKVNEFRLFKARLEIQAREIKEALMTTDERLSVDVSPVFPEPVSIERSELEVSLPVKAALFGIRDGLRVFLKEAIKAIGMHRFDPGLTEIIVTGGGAFLPSVVDCVREAVATLGPAYPAKVKADYVSPLYTSIPNIGHLYPLLAVSLGSTEKEYPDVQVVSQAPAPQAAAVVSAAAPVTPPRPRPRPEVKMPTKGTSRLTSRFRLT